MEVNMKVTLREIYEHYQRHTAKYKMLIVLIQTSLKVTESLSHEIQKVNV